LAFARCRHKQVAKYIKDPDTDTKVHIFWGLLNVSAVYW
jgi:hypothetical protein